MQLTRWHERAGAARRTGPMVANNTVVALIILIALIIGFTLLTENNVFLSKNTVRLFLNYVPEIALMTIGMAILLILGEIDLSIGSIYVFSSVILAGLHRDYGVHILLAIPLTLLAGAAMGALNGILTTRMRIVSFIITLGTMWAYRGIMLVLVGGTSMRITLTEFEQSVVHAFAGKVRDVPMHFLWLILVTIVLRLVLQRTRFGNWIFATGSNARAAKMMGINTNRVKVYCFALSGFLCAFAGFIQVGRTSHAIPQSGESVMLSAIAGAIIGGTSLRGGRGSVLGAVFGAFILQVVSLGFIMLGFIEYYTNIVIALALILTAYSYTWLGKSGAKGESE